MCPCRSLIIVAWFAADADSIGEMRQGKSGPKRKRWRLGYDPMLFQPRDVLYVGSCGYESLSDQMYNDGGAKWARVKRKLLTELKRLPVDERKLYVVAIAGPDAVVDFSDQREVCTTKHTNVPLATQDLTLAL